MLRLLSLAFTRWIGPAGSSVEAGEIIVEIGAGGMLRRALA